MQKVMMPDIDRAFFGFFIISDDFLAYRSSERNYHFYSDNCTLDATERFLPQSMQKTNIQAGILSVLQIIQGKIMICMNSNILILLPERKIAV